MTDPHEAKTVAIDPGEVTRAERVALRAALLSLINECTRAMTMPKQPPTVVASIRELIEQVTKTLESLAQAG